MNKYNFQYKFRISMRDAYCMIEEWNESTEMNEIQISDILQKYGSSLGNYKLSMCPNNLDLIITGQFDGILDFNAYKFLSQYTRPFVVVDKKNKMIMKREKGSYLIIDYRINLENLPEMYCDEGEKDIYKDQYDRQDILDAKNLYGIDNILSLIKKLREIEVLPSINEIAKSIAKEEAYIPLLEDNEVVIKNLEEILIELVKDVSNWSDKDINKEIRRIRNSSCCEDRDILYDHIWDLVQENVTDLVDCLLGGLHKKFEYEALECFYCSECTAELKGNVSHMISEYIKKL